MTRANDRKPMTSYWHLVVSLVTTALFHLVFKIATVQFFSFKDVSAISGGHTTTRNVGLPTCQDIAINRFLNMVVAHHLGFLVCVWTTHKEYRGLFLQSLVGINAVVLKICKFLYFASLKIAINASFLGIFGDMTHKWAGLSIKSQKAHPCTESSSRIEHQNWFIGVTCAHEENKQWQTEYSRRPPTLSDWKQIMHAVVFGRQF